MILYAESSAVLRWLLGAPRGEDVRKLLAAAELVCASRLTLLECRRALVRGRILGEVSEVAALDAESRLAEAASRWVLSAISDDVAQRAEQAFPAEPLRTLDAVHLASALLFLGELGGVVVLSTDERVVKNARGLGLAVAPEP